MLCNDAVCPGCGQWLWRFRNLFSDELGIPQDEIRFDTLLEELVAGYDGLEVMEAYGAIEEKLGVRLPDGFWDRFQSVGDVIEYFRRRREVG